MFGAFTLALLAFGSYAIFIAWFCRGGAVSAYAP